MFGSVTWFLFGVGLAFSASLALDTQEENKRLRKEINKYKDLVDKLNNVTDINVGNVGENNGN